MFYLKEAIEIAAQQGQITGPSIKAAMYAKENWVPLGLEGVCRPATWQADDHRGVNEVLIYQAEVTDFPAQTSLERLFVDKKMSMQQVFLANIPRRPEWLGF